MATHRWLGQAVAVAQTATVQITAYDVATAYKLTVGGVVVSTVGTGGTVNTTATALAAAWNASTHVYFTGVTASAATDTVTLTADTAGVPFTATSSVTGGTGTIGSVTAGTANAGPNVLAAANLDSGSLPANGDTLIFENSAVDVLWVLDAMTSTTTLTIIRYPTYTGKIGLNRRVFQVTASSTSSTAKEYREHSLTIDGATLIWMPKRTRGAAATSQRFIVNTKTSAATVLIEETGTSASEVNLEPVRIKGSNSSSIATVNGSSIVGFATDDPADTAEFDLNVAGRAIVNATDNVTIDILTLRESPSVRIAKAPTTIDGKDEETTAVLTTAMTSGTITTATVGEKMTWKHVGSAITGTTINQYGTIDLSGARGNLTGTTWNVLAKEAVLIDPFNRTPANQRWIFGGAVGPAGFLGLAGGRTVEKVS